MFYISRTVDNARPVATTVLAFICGLPQLWVGHPPSKPFLSHAESMGITFLGSYGVERKANRLKNDSKPHRQPKESGQATWREHRCEKDKSK